MSNGRGFICGDIYSVLLIAFVDMITRSDSDTMVLLETTQGIISLKKLKYKKTMGGQICPDVCSVLLIELTHTIQENGAKKFC